MKTDETSKTTQAWSIGRAVVFALTAMYLGYRNIGMPPVVIVGSSSPASL